MLGPASSWAFSDAVINHFKNHFEKLSGSEKTVVDRSVMLKLQNQCYITNTPFTLIKHENNLMWYEQLTRIY